MSEEATIQIVYDVVLETKADVKEVKERVRCLEDTQLSKDAQGAQRQRWFQAGRVAAATFGSLIGAVVALLGVGWIT